MDENNVQNSFLWENQEWGFINSDYSVGGNAENSGKKVPYSNVFNGSSPPLLPVDVTPSPSRKRVAPAENNSGGDNQENEEKGGGDNRERANCGHIWIERERRKKMKNMFTILKDLLHQLPSKVGKTVVLDETVKHIKALETTLNDLQKQKAERLEMMMKTRTNLGMNEMAATREVVLAPSFPVVFKTWTSPNIVLNVCGFDAHINICCPSKLGLLAAICSVLEKYNIDVLSAHVSSDHNKSMYMIHACVAIEYACQFPIEEIYKQATIEIITICQ